MKPSFPTLPRLSLYDPVIKSEGSIDPLGTYPIADNLAYYLAPGVRERQRHPRFLTAIAVGLVVCNEYSEDTVAGDHVSPPWQVYEWLMVESLVKSMHDEKQLLGLPGSDKATQTIRQGLHLNAGRYLKMPTVFGFHGVYRRLSKALNIEEGGQLGETGALLMSAWEKEQGLDGFYGSNSSSEGGRYRRTLANTIKKSLDAAAAVVNSECCEFFSKYLAPYQAGAKEQEVISRALMSAIPLRREYLKFLISKKGRSLIEKEGENKELELLVELRKQCSAEMAGLLETILAYEEFIGTIEKQFYAILHMMNTGKSYYKHKEIIDQNPTIKQAALYLPEHFDKTAELLARFNKSGEFISKFGRFKERVSPENWLSLLIDYHEDIQRQKPPVGKASWFERYSDEHLAARPAYRHMTRAIHGYRAQPLVSFIEDLRIKTNA